MDMKFWFENGCQSTEALVTAIRYDEFRGCVLKVLGLDSNGYNYTNYGELQLNAEAMEELMESHELELPHEIIGRKIKIVATIIE